MAKWYAVNTFFIGLGISITALIILIVSSISYSRAGRAAPIFSKLILSEDKPTRSASHRGKLRKIGIGTGISVGVIFIGFIVLALIVPTDQDIEENKIEEDRLKTSELSLDGIKQMTLYDVSYDDLF